MSQGQPPDLPQPRLRWAVFSLSVVSAVENPDAYLLRALGRQLTAQGHEVTFFEERGNLAVRALLRRSGGRALADFQERFPEIDYRTVDPLSGVVLVEWLTRTLGTYDVAILQPDAPAELASWIGRMTRHHLQTYLLDTGLVSRPAASGGVTEDPGDFSGVLAGSDALVDRYARLIPRDRVHRFGPLPEPHRLAEPSETEARQLEAVVRELASTLAWVATRAQQAHHTSGAL